ncbi:ROK family glucokinase [uncultured Serinicoccus sp.]|uniref:ROK family glucokinase n=1 Tax=uncultured Serinicoccus sp. TaxID=735514 RepID=UPI002605675C|nr:ROK family glucokinase [uncultured Serinicoccus sp.]
MSDPAEAPALPAVGVDVGGTHVKAGLVDAQGRVTSEAYRRTPARTAAVAVVEGLVVEVVQELLQQVPPGVRARVPVGVGAAGFVDADRGRVVFAPHLSWRDEPLRDTLAARLGRPVVLDNDAHAAAWAEHRFGAGQGESHLVVLTLGTGIGGAILTHGRLQRGRHGLAGEFGHQQLVPGGLPCECGNQGCWEQYASGRALARLAQEALRVGGPAAAGLRDACPGGGPSGITGEHVWRAARDGDPTSRTILAEVGRWLGTGLAGVVGSLDPGTVVVGGGVSGAGDLLLDPARETLAGSLVGRGHRPVPPVLAARLGQRAGVVGAADLARRRDRASFPRRAGDR